MKKEDNNSCFLSNPLIDIDNELSNKPPIKFNVVDIKDYLPPPPIIQNPQIIIQNNNNVYEYLDNKGVKKSDNFMRLMTSGRNKAVEDYYKINKNKIERDYDYNKNKGYLKGIGIEKYKYDYYYRNVQKLKNLNDKNEPMNGSYYKEIKTKNYKGEPVIMKSFINNPKIRKQLTYNNLKDELFITKFSVNKRIEDWKNEFIKDDKNKIKNEVDTFKEDSHTLKK